MKNRWIGLRMEDPVPNIAKLAEAQGAVGIGPVTSAADAAAAIAKGVDVLKKGGVCVIDFHVEPPAERQANHGLGHRATNDSGIRHPRSGLTGLEGWSGHRSPMSEIGLSSASSL